MTSKKLNIQWAAGLYEGEGSFHLNRSGGKYRYPRLQVANTDRDVLEEFQRIVKGGSILGPYKTEKYGGTKDIYRFTANGPDAIRIATRLRPYVNGRRGRKIDEVLTAKHGRQ